MRILLAFLLLWPALAAAQDISKPNGSRAGDTFTWSNGGGDPYQGSLAHAFAIIGVPTADRTALLAKVSNTAGQRYAIENGDRFQTMVSGQQGWVTTNVVAQTSSWRAGRTKAATVWYYTSPSGLQYRVVRAHVCGNWLVDVYGSPQVLNCRCHVASGDAC